MLKCAHCPEVHFVCRCAALRFFCARAVCAALSRFLQRRAPLPIIETQKSLWNVSDVDRRETGLFRGKNDVTVWITKFLF